jgi:uncharacterized protein YxeA
MKKYLKRIIVIIILLICVFFAYNFYAKNNFNNFLKGESNLYTSTFSRDKTEKYTNESSYKIESDDYNDAMFYETVKLEKNTPYKVTCMVKTKDVVSKNQSAGSGAQISIEDTTERSTAISGTTDWQQIELIFNSKDREEVEIGFRLGGYLDDCKGEAWFTDFKIEKGTKTDTNNTNWKFAFFIFDEVSAKVGNETLDYTLTSEDYSDMKSTINRLSNTCSNLSKGKMTVESDAYKISDPITTLSYDDDYGYYVAPEDVESQIKDIIDNNDYDHIFIVFKLDDDEVEDWVGLGAMDYYGVGYSNIRLPNEKNSYIYKYDTRANTFPEEVLLHEFLHSLERTSKEYGYDIPALHDNELYGYENKKLIGLKEWYQDYMNCEIKTSDGYIGLDSSIYSLKPAKKSDFIYSVELSNPFEEPQNTFEAIAQIFKNAKRNTMQILEKI